MNHDKFIGSYITAVKKAVEDTSMDIVGANFEDMYQIGLLQGSVRGLKSALDILEQLYREQDQ